MRKKNSKPVRFLPSRHFPSNQNQDLMLEDRSSKNNSRETNPWAAYRIEGLELRQEKHPLENSQGGKAAPKLELTLAYGGFPVTPTPQSENSTKTDNQYNKKDGLDLGLGTLLHQLTPPQKPVHQNEPGSDTSSLIDTIGRDNTLNCLLRCPRATYGSIASLNRSFRDIIRSGEIYKLRRDNKVIEFWVYFTCHVAKWQVFDPSTKTWMRLPMLDAGNCFHFSDKESIAVGKELLVLGQDLTGHATYKYSLLTNSWSLGNTMNTPRCLFASASLGQVAIFAGGVTKKGEVLDTVELYDSRSGNWETIGSMIKPRKLCSGVFMDDKFYVIGGVGNDLKKLTCGEEYDLDTKKWKVVPNLSPVDGRGGWMAAAPLVAVVGNELYAADAAEMELKKFDKEKKEWKVIGRLPERVHSVNGWGMGFRGCGERVVVIGGPRRIEGNVLEVYSWVPSKGPPEWSLIGQKVSDAFIFNSAVMGC